MPVTTYPIHKDNPIIVEDTKIDKIELPEDIKEDLRNHVLNRNKEIVEVNFKRYGKNSINNIKLEY